MRWSGSNRHALRFGALLAPVVRFYWILLFPVAKPTAMVLDRWLGQEAISYFKERGIREFIKLHMASSGDVSDEFLSRVHRSGKKWIVLADMEDEPGMVLDSDEFIRDALFDREQQNPYRHCHRPIIARDGGSTIGDVLSLLRVNPEHGQDDVVDHDVILLWGEDKRIITGGDVLGRLLRGIVRNPAADP